jgi:uncharacterized protein YdeI (YjbR/CyaY-like superfamily)
MPVTKTVYAANREEWRAWLAKHHDSETEVWLIYYKKHTGRPRVSYNDAVEEALCFGWIDSLVHTIDDEKFAQKFTPRKDRTRWSELNKRRVRKLMKDGRMTAAGLAKIDRAALAAKPKPRPGGGRSVPAFVSRGLRASPTAWANFRKMAPSYRRLYALWIMDAKKAQTRERRLKETIRRLERNEKPGLK